MLGLTLPRARLREGLAGLLNLCLVPQAGRWGTLEGEAAGEGSPRGSLPPLAGLVCLLALPVLVADRRMLLRVLLRALPGALVPAAPGLCMLLMSSLGTARLAAGLPAPRVLPLGLNSWEVLTEEVRLMVPAGHSMRGCSASAAARARHALSPCMWAMQLGSHIQSTAAGVIGPACNSVSSDTLATWCTCWHHNMLQSHGPWLA